MSSQARPEVGSSLLSNLQMVRLKSSVTKQQMKLEVTHFQPLLLPDLFILLLFIGSDYYHQRHCGLNHFSSGSLDVTHNTIFMRKKKISRQMRLQLGYTIEGKRTRALLSSLLFILGCHRLPRRPQTTWWDQLTDAFLSKW